MPGIEHYRNRLLKMQAKLTRRLDAIDKDIRHEGMTADWSEQATERENDEVLESLGNLSARQLAKINTALQRIDSGEYFYCSVCGDKIPAPRLELLPFTNYCVACAQSHESMR